MLESGKRIALALVAMFRRGEHSAAVVAALVPFAGVILLVLAEFLVGHD